MAADFLDQELQLGGQQDLVFDNQDTSSGRSFITKPNLPQ